MYSLLYQVIELHNQKFLLIYIKKLSDFQAVVFTVELLVGERIFSGMILNAAIWNPTAKIPKIARMIRVLEYPIVIRVPPKMTKGTLTISDRVGMRL